MLLDERGVGHMQGAAVVGGTYYVTRQPGPLAASAACTSARRAASGAYRWALPVGPEDITYWPSTNTLWSLSEYPGRRWVYA